MPVVKPSPDFSRWAQSLSAHERGSIMRMIGRLRATGLMPKDPELVELVSSYSLQRRVFTEVGLYVMADLIQSGPGRNRKRWFGISRGLAGDPQGVDMLIILKAWTSNPATTLADRLRTETELKSLADSVCP